MFLIAGLGNPEEDYSNTRHNMGFDTINKLALQYNIELDKKKYKGLCGKGIIENEKVILLKPQTFMNLSGESIKEAMNFYKVRSENLIVVYDDIDIEPGIIKIRKKGGSGGHNGMKSVISEIKCENFPRIRIGIGKPERKGQLIEYVIGSVSEADRKILDSATTKGKDAIIEILKNGVDIAMNKFN